MKFYKFRRYFALFLNGEYSSKLCEVINEADEVVLTGEGSSREWSADIRMDDLSGKSRLWCWSMSNGSAVLLGSHASSAWGEYQFGLGCQVD